MLRIIIVQKKILNSFILRSKDSGMITEHLPEKLRDRVADALKILCDNDVNALEYDNEAGVLLLQDGRPFAFDPAPEFLTRDFVRSLADTMYLLAWFIGPHISPPSPWQEGGWFLCNNCGRHQVFFNNNKCLAPECSSHKKWAEVIDGYVPPENVPLETSMTGVIGEKVVYVRDTELDM